MSRARATVAIKRPLVGRVEVIVPFSPHTRAWLKGVCGRGHIEWERHRRVWTVPRSHFERVTLALADRHGFCDTYLSYSTRTVCTPSCKAALIEECVCSCLGVNHKGRAAHLKWEDRGVVQVSTEETVVHRRAFRDTPA
jgi:hypothetical protein